MMPFDQVATGYSPNPVIEAIVAIVAAAIGIGFYFLPAIVAASSHKRQTLVIFVFNLLLGWTFVGWVIAFVWATMPDR